jgi:chemotaxis protein CheD
MKSVHVGIGEYYVSRDKDEEIKTFALGSCVGVLVYDKAKKIAGLIHIALPDSSINENKGQELPGYFVDTGMPRFMHELKKLRASRENSWIKIVGGSNIMDVTHRFDIGKRNVLAVKKFLWKQQLGIIAEDVGGDVSRTVSVRVADGTVTVSTDGKKREL